MYVTTHNHTPSNKRSKFLSHSTTKRKSIHTTQAKRVKLKFHKPPRQESITRKPNGIAKRINIDKNWKKIDTSPYYNRRTLSLRQTPPTISPIR